MRTLLVCVLFVALIAIISAYPDLELEENNKELFDVNAEGVEHDEASRQARQFGYGRFGGPYGYRPFGGFGGYRGFGYGGGYGGYGRFGRFGGFYG